MTVTTLRVLHGAGEGAAAGSVGFAVGFLDQDGVEWRAPLEDAAGLTFESYRPVRSFPSFRGQRNWPGLWWSATHGGHVGYESWLERDHAMLLDFDREVVAFAPQPFWLFFSDAGRPRSHAPDFFARRRDGSAVVIDCRPDERIKPRDADAFDMTARACESVGWEYRRVGALDPVRAGNLRWLSGYRHSRFADPVVAQRLVAMFAVPRALTHGAELAGPPTAVLPVLFHLLWRQELRADLTAPLCETSLVWTAG